MKAAIESTLTLETVAEHFEQWRSAKKKRERIPDHLWREAIDLLDRYGISHVIRTLRLNGSDLNKRRGITARTQRAKVTATKASRKAPAFVEIDPQAVAQASGRDTTASWLELQRPDGLCLRIHPSEGRELLALVDRFMGT